MIGGIVLTTLGFKEILWDSGGVWVLVLAIFLGGMFDILRTIMKASKEK